MFGKVGSVLIEMGQEDQRWRLAGEKRRGQAVATWNKTWVPYTLPVSESIVEYTRIPFQTKPHLRLQAAENQGILKMENLSQNLQEMGLEADGLLSDSVHVCVKILMQKNLVEREMSENLSREALDIGFLMSDMILEFFENLKKTEDELLYLEDEDVERPFNAQNIDEDSPHCETAEDSATPSESIESSQSNSQQDSRQTDATSGTDRESQSQSQHSEYVPSPKKCRVESIPLATKIKIINKAREHPNWSLKTLQNNGCMALTRMDTLARWSKDIEKGGTQNDESEYIHEKTFELFKDARAKRLPIHTRNVQEWAIQAALQFRSGLTDFCASDSWVDRFKARYGIRQRKITRYLKPTEIRSLETLQYSANCVMIVKIVPARAEMMILSPKKPFALEM
ncbi:hypothetical protein QAD02_016077 [Eretmocerus hayati]|uniref:Uncharacterized protein n=1 Tax=Eretmocerus hayati TaxID=131215 RepID=A0ACC2P9L7_9HYME|nr:hypothetical protein QAD02_016077 [Eretmocerus hayati]